MSTPESEALTGELQGARQPAGLDLGRRFVRVTERKANGFVAFDFALGEIWIGDVGQDTPEEVNRVLLEPDEPPKNLGWSAFEGTERVEGDELGDGEVVWPVATYSHEDGCSVTGGVVYRGTRLRRLAGRYVYGDFCSGALWSLQVTPGKGAADVRRERATVPQLAHIGTDADGELLFASVNGAVFRAVRP